MKKKSSRTEQCKKIDSLFSSKDHSFVEMGFSLLEPLLTDPNIRLYYKQRLKINSYGVVWAPSAFAESTRVRLLLILASYYTPLAHSITKLNLEGCSHKEVIAPQLHTLPNLIELNLSLRWDEQELDLPKLLEAIESIDGLKRLRILNWNKQKGIPSLFHQLEKVSFSTGYPLPLPTSEEFLGLSKGLQFMYVENLKNDPRQKGKDRFDGVLDATDFFGFINAFQVSRDGWVECKDDFYENFKVSPAALYNIHKYKPQNLPQVATINICSEHIDLLTKTPNVYKLTLRVAKATKVISLKGLARLKNLTLINVPTELYLANILTKLEVYGSVSHFSFIQIGANKYFDFYEVMTLNKGQYGKKRWHYSNEHHPEIRDLPPLTKHSLAFITSDLETKMWARKEAKFWVSYLTLNSKKYKQILAECNIQIRTTMGRWSVLGQFDFLWALWVKSNIPNLPEYIKVDSCAVNGLTGNLKGVYIKVIEHTTLELEALDIETLKIKGHRHLIECTIPASVTELNIENVHLRSLNVDACKENLTSLTLVSLRKEDLPDLSMFPNLTTLKLINCHMDSLNTLPANLEHLNISFNPLPVFPTSILACTQIKVLEMASVPFTSVPNEIQNLQYIERVSITNSALQNLDFLTLLPNLETLKIGYNLEVKPWHFGTRKHLHATNRSVPMLPPGLSNLRKLIVNDSLAISLGAYEEYTLEELDIQYAGNGTAVHLIKQFKHIKTLRGFLPNDTQPTIKPGVPTPVKRALPAYSRASRGYEYDANYRSWGGYFSKMDPKFEKGLELYRSLLKK